MKKLLLILIFLPLFMLAQQSPSSYFSQDVLDINNVNTSVGPGSMFWDLADPRYEVPKGSNKHSIFAHDLWIGGVDDGGALRLAAQTYRQNGNDYWPGPVSDSIYHNDANMGQWDRVWKIDRSVVEEHQTRILTDPTYIIPDIILNWPAHGDVSMGQSPYLAPFFDANGNGLYEPYDGDYPDIKGDQAIYIIRNDVGDVHTESDGEQIGLEMHIMYYAYRCDNYPELDHTVFAKTTLYNRGKHNLNDTYIGTWTDMDLGFYLDDYVGCNVPLNLSYTYNGDMEDEGSAGYGFNPPAQGLVYLNGTMDKFMYYNNDFTVIGNPSSAPDYYNYLRGIWKDNVPMTYAGDGHGGGAGATTNLCEYMFPGTTDVNFTTPWSEVTAGNIPADRRFLMSNGPFDLDTNTSYTLEYAFVFAWDSTNTNGGSVPMLFNYTQNIQDFYDGTLIMPCSNINAINDVSDLSKGRLVKIIDVLGRETIPKSNMPLFYIYDGGTVEKRIVIE
jgi:hypothetical protein